jgi:hypothetical protein
MAHITRKYPLEKLHQNVLAWLPVITLHILHMQAWVRRVWAAMINEQAHHGAGLLLSGDSLRCQSPLAMAVGGSDRAMIVQKLHEWIEYNRTEGHTDKKRDGVWWTYNSYADWSRAHFGWLSDDAIGRHVRALEKMGVIRTRQMKKRDRSKWYTIEYGKLNALLKDLKTTAALNLHPAKTHSHRANLNSHHANSHDDSSSKPIKKTKAVTQEKTTPLPASDAARLETAALTEQTQNADSDSHAIIGQDVIGQREETGDSDFVETTPPSSATPPIDEAARDTWALASDQLSLKSPEFKRWLKESALRNYQCIDGTAIYTVIVPNVHAQDQMQHRYYRNIEREFSWRHSGPVKIEFEVDACHTT